MTTQKWYKFFLWLTLISFVDSASYWFVKSYFPSLPQGFGVVSLVFAILVQFSFSKTIIGWFGGVLFLFHAWPIWAVAALYFERKLKKLKPNKQVKKV